MRDLYQQALRATGSTTNPDKEHRFAILEDLARSKRGGIFAEVGCWHGHSTWILSEFAKRVYAFDTFKGMPPNEEEGWPEGEFNEPLETFRFRERPNVRAYPADIREGFPIALPSRLDLVHLDVDIASSYSAAIEALWPRLKRGGIMVFDDHGCKGCEPATELIETLVRARSKMFVAPIGGGAFAVK
jgi:O-methyltransferase